MTRRTTLKYLGIASATALIGLLVIPALAANDARETSQEEQRGRGRALRDFIKPNRRESDDASPPGQTSKNKPRSQQGIREIDVSPSPAPSGSPSPDVSASPSPRRGAPGKLRACEAHMRSIQRRSEHLVRMATKMLTVFAKITQRVQEYYTTVVLPSGRSVANYDALLADIVAKRGAVEVALAQARATAGLFSCTAENPKETLRQFRLDMRGVKQALHAYRKAVRNLIVAVRTIAPVSSPSPSISPSPTPSESPSPYPTP